MVSKSNPSPAPTGVLLGPDQLTATLRVIAGEAPALRAAGVKRVELGALVFDLDLAPLAPGRAPGRGQPGKGGDADPDDPDNDPDALFDTGKAFAHRKAPAPAGDPDR